MCGRFTLAELVSFLISVCVVCVWVLTGHWALMDFMGMGLCVAFIAFVRLPSLKVSTLLLSGLLLYDVFWVFFSQVKNTKYFCKKFHYILKCMKELILSRCRARRKDQDYNFHDGERRDLSGGQLTVLSAVLRPEKVVWKAIKILTKLIKFN